MYDVVVLTESRYENPTDIDWYVENILREDGLVKNALEQRGLRVARLDWNTPDFDWSQTKAALFRTTWDYFHKFKEFEAWLNHVNSQTMLINSYDQIKWNMDKHYLQDLAKLGVNITETRFIKSGLGQNLVDIYQETGWGEGVLKPTVSGAGRHTYKLDHTNVGQYSSTFEELIAEEDMMLQPFQFNVPTKGEVAYMVIGGQCTHAVLKKAKPGDFRVQDDFGGTVHAYEPSEEEIAFVEHAVSVLDPQPVYARVDVIWDNDDKLAISELELIEPEMWFRFNHDAADVLAETIVQHLK